MLVEDLEMAAFLANDVDGRFADRREGECVSFAFAREVRGVVVSGACCGVNVGAIVDLDIAVVDVTFWSA